MNNYKNTRCNFCGTLNNAHHSAECIDTNAKGYEATTTPPVSQSKSSELLIAIEQLALAINSRPDDKAVVMPPEVWGKYWAVLDMAGFKRDIGD